MGHFGLGTTSVWALVGYNLSEHLYRTHLRRKRSLIVKTLVVALASLLVVGMVSAQTSGGMSGGMMDGDMMSGGMSGGMMSGGMMSGGSMMMDSSLEVALTGDQQTPPVMTEATGSATVALSGDTLTITGDFSDLSSPQVGGHVHMAAAGTSGDVIYPLNISADADGLSGVFSLSTSLTAEQVAAYESGDLYINIHSEMNPNGEIRGQIVPSM